MANPNSIIQLIDALNELNSGEVCCSESANRQVSEKAIELVRQSDLDDQARSEVVRAISRAANPSGWYYECNGIKAGVEALSALESEVPQQGFNIRNLANLVSDGAIFYVEFIKRSTGELRKMRCRLGVKKHLKGGSRAYNPAKKNLLAVFDMDERGYRSIPLEGIRRLSVGGQHFDFEGGTA